MSNFYLKYNKRYIGFSLCCVVLLWNGYFISWEIKVKQRWKKKRKKKISRKRPQLSLKIKPHPSLVCGPVSRLLPPSCLRPLLRSSPPPPPLPRRNPKWTPAPARTTPPVPRRRSSATSAAAARAWSRPSPTVRYRRLAPLFRISPA